VSWQDEYFAMISETAELARTDMRKLAAQVIPEPFYLYYRPCNEQTGEWGELKMFAQSNSPKGDEWKLATGEPLRINIPYEKYWQWIRDNSRQIPIIGMNSRTRKEEVK